MTLPEVPAQWTAIKSFFAPVLRRYRMEFSHAVLEQKKNPTRKSKIGGAKKGFYITKY